jgi:hypothetical protein
VRTRSISGAEFLRGGARPPAKVSDRVHQRTQGDFGVEPTCWVLTEHGCPIAPTLFQNDTTVPAGKAPGAVPFAHPVRLSVSGDEDDDYAQAW